MNDPGVVPVVKNAFREHLLDVYAEAIDEVAKAQAVLQVATAFMESARAAYLGTWKGIQ